MVAEAAMEVEVGESVCCGVGAKVVVGGGGAAGWRWRREWWGG